MRKKEDIKRGRHVLGYNSLYETEEPVASYTLKMGGKPTAPSVGKENTYEELLPVHETSFQQQAAEEKRTDTIITSENISPTASCKGDMP
jgi:hypothetical protein